jgi:hypothetical protein
MDFRSLPDEVLDEPRVKEQMGEIQAYFSAGVPAKRERDMATPPAKKRKLGEQPSPAVAPLTFSSLMKCGEGWRVCVCLVSRLCQQV